MSGQDHYDLPAAPSPDVVIPLPLSLQAKGNYGKARGSLTIVIATASCDDVIATFAFGRDLRVVIVHSAMGIAIGVFCGLGPLL